MVKVWISGFTLDSLYTILYFNRTLPRDALLIQMQEIPQ